MSLLALSANDRPAFEVEGVDGILLGYQARAGYLYKEQRMEVPIVVETIDHWLLEELSTHLSQHYDVEFKSRQSYYDLFTQAGLSWNSTQKRNPKNDPEAVAAQKKSPSQCLQQHQEDALAG